MYSAVQDNCLPEHESANPIVPYCIFVAGAEEESL
jgi:hypothetical protein